MAYQMYTATGCSQCRITKRFMKENNICYEEYDIKGPANLYGPLTGTAIDESELTETISLAARFPEYQFYTTIAPLEREDSNVAYLTPEEIGETANVSKKIPCTLRIFDPKHAEDDRFKSVDQ